MIILCFLNMTKRLNLNLSAIKCQEAQIIYSHQVTEQTSKGIYPHNGSLITSNSYHQNRNMRNVNFLKLFLNFVEIIFLELNKLGKEPFDTLHSDVFFNKGVTYALCGEPGVYWELPQRTMQPKREESTQYLLRVWFITKENPADTQCDDYFRV